MCFLQREALFLRLLFHECKAGWDFAVVFFGRDPDGLCYITHVQGKLYSFSDFLNF